MAVARSFFGGLTIRYILPFLWMESHFAIVGPMVALLSVCDNFGMV